VLRPSTLTSLRKQKGDEVTSRARHAAIDRAVPPLTPILIEAEPATAGTEA